MKYIVSEMDDGSITIKVSRSLRNRINRVAGALDMSATELVEMAVWRQMIDLDRVVVQGGTGKAVAAEPVPVPPPSQVPSAGFAGE